MAKLERALRGDFDTVLQRLHQGVLDASATASCEDSSDFTVDGVRCAVRMYERYSAFGGNRVAMSVTLVGGQDGLLRLTALSAGGSQAMFFKLNTIGEESFLGTLESVVNELERGQGW